MRWLLALTVLVLVSPATFAEKPPRSSPAKRFQGEQSEVRALLDSENRTDLAWGAYLAGRGGHKKLVPQLLSRLRQENELPPLSHDAIRNALLDALIRLDAVVPSKLLMQRLTPRTLVPTLLLLAKDPWGNRDALLDLMRREPLDGAHRWGAAFVLAIQRPRGLAARMLEDVRFRLDVTVHDPGAKAPGIGIGGGGGATTRGGRDLPPYAHYVLFDTPLRGSLSVKWAKPHLFALRKEYAGPSLTTMQKTLPDARTRHALRVLAVMLSEEPKAYAAIGRSSIGVAWVSPEQLQAHVAREKDRLRLIWQSLVDDLRNAELLEEDGAPAQPSIDVLVRDDRKVKEPPLPEIE